MEYLTTLDRLPPGQKATVEKLMTDESMRHRLADLGLIEHTSIECLGRSPLKDPSAYLIRGSVLALRAEDSRKILIKTRKGECHD